MLPRKCSVAACRRVEQVNRKLPLFGLPGEPRRRSTRRSCASGETASVTSWRPWRVRARTVAAVGLVDIGADLPKWSPFSCEPHHVTRDVDADRSAKGHAAQHDRAVGTELLN